VSYRVTLERLPPYVVAGRDVKFEGSLTIDGRPAPRETVRVMACAHERPEVCQEILRLTTGAMGEFYDIWRPPHGMACRRFYFFAEHVASRTRSEPQLVAVAYPTRLGIRAPPTVTVGQSFEVSGRLEYEVSPGSWAGLAGRRVRILLNETTVAEVATQSDGSFSARLTIPRPGTHTIRAVFPGEGLPATQVAAVSDTTEYLPSVLGVGSVIVAVVAPLFATLF
jgi:hypothetical protein